MITQTIEVEGLPEGWKAVAYRVPKTGEWFLGDYSKEVHKAIVCVQKAFILEKIQPRRIVLEETWEVNFLSKGEWFESCEGNFIQWNSPNISKTAHMIWKQVKETDIPLTNDEPNVKMGKSEGDADEPNLSLSLEQCKKFFNGTITDRLEVFQLVEDFIKENS